MVHHETHQHMPDVLIGSFEAAEADADTQKALASPHVARGDGGLPQLQCLAAIHQHLHRLLHVSLQEVLQRVVVFVLHFTKGVRQTCGSTS